MAFRIVEVSSHCKLEYSLNYLVYRTAEETKRISLDEISVLIIESTAVALTSSLLAELVSRKINTIFCDEKHNPISQLIPLHGSSETSLTIQKQIDWIQEDKDTIWQRIVTEKIKNQASVLSKYSPGQEDRLYDSLDKILPGDTTNWEGHCANYYFSHLFGKDFTRDSQDERNAFLNYGYAIILSLLNRSIAAKGCITQIGFHHRNQYNAYNLACDLMEPFRPIVDDKIHGLTKENFKEKLRTLSQTYVTIRGCKQTLSNAIDLYVSSIISAMNSHDFSQVAFMESYEL